MHDWIGRARVRGMRAADLDSVKVVIDSTGLFPSALLDEMAAAHLDGNAQEHWLVLDADGPVAVAYCAPERMTEGTWNMLLLAVRADRQGRGLGRLLVRAAERVVARDDARIMLVETSGLPEFERTRAFYRGCGYDEEARIRDFYRAGEDKIVFRRELPG